MEIAADVDSVFVQLHLQFFVDVVINYLQTWFVK